MSTRGQIRFIQRIESHEADSRIAQIYRHSDGYPEAVLDDLARLKQLLDATRSERGAQYAAAQFIFLDKLTSMEMYLNGDPERTIAVVDPADLLESMNFSHLDQPAFLLGHGVEDPQAGIHGDEEFLYEVELPYRNIAEEPSEWTVRVSEHCGFPTGEELRDAAFEKALWQFEGSLDWAEQLPARDVYH